MGVAPTLSGDTSGACLVVVTSFFEELNERVPH